MNNFQFVPFDPQTAFTEREVEFVKWVRCGERDDYLWAKVLPPFEPYVFATNDPIDTVLVGARHQGESLRTISGARHVYVCLPKVQELLLADSIEPDQISILNSAILVPDT